ncbi:MAG: helix-turn-helix transcriptional regulator [Hyphomicrobiaceae bacterium]|nr:helix-turn-helix transcriptional regulator [Hyphomicrobiaceae bacterium]
MASITPVVSAITLSSGRQSIGRAMLSWIAASATTSQVLMQRPATFAARLRWWRERRRLSQLELAGRADISQRHLSFLELGRASPSREMVLRLAEALDVPLRQHNALLLAAGFAPAWREATLAAPELAQVARAVDYMLAQQQPFPAVAVDRHWNLLKANPAAVCLVEFLVGPLPAGEPVNLADALVAPHLLRPFLENWPQVARYFIRSVELDASSDGSDATSALLERLLAYDGVRELVKGPALDGSAPVLPMHFRKGETVLSLFTTIATLGTPSSVTAQELRVESFFPADDASAEVLRRWARR